MDEPLSNLDAKLRVQTRTQIASLQRRLGVTTVYVTHDQTEALTMGDRIAVLKDGVLQQVGTPRELYAAPKNVFVAGFIGSPAMNFIPADGGQLHGVRPEDLVVSSTGDGIKVLVDVIEELGADGYLYGSAEFGGRKAEIVARVDGRKHPKPGEHVVLTPRPDRIHVFDEATGDRLSAPIADEE